ncbi:hypothetical protein [Helicobacter anatolicus]|uniref:hypothetical protein n=1 Tax=Helicobacter anatolicus TaxID=2905874 RepID=UPI001E518C60|nr:hypothetical protein [Helicobacter anatolicus]MCE3039653.1 hypothetical protein [Helicobacter anatolicus]
MKTSRMATALISLGLMGLEAGSLKDFVENATVDGFGRVKYTHTEGEDGYGRGYQILFKPEVTSGDVAGFSFTGGIFFSTGSAAPDGNATDDSIGGSRGFKFNNQLDWFSVSKMYVTKKFDNEKTTIKLGIMEINTPLNTTSAYGDRGIGASLENKSIEGMKFYISLYDSWMTDNLMLQTTNSAIPDVSPSGATKSVYAFQGVGNNLLIAGWSGDFGSVGVKDLHGTFYYAYANKLFDAMIFGDLGYTFSFGDFKLDVMGQIGYTEMFKTPDFYSKSPILDGYFTTRIHGLGENVEYAKNRGVYNLRLGFNYKDYSGDVGYLGSFGEGYGAMLDNKGAFKYGGVLWNAVLAGGMMGIGWTGTGGIKDTDLILAYTTHNYKINKFKIGLDFVYVGGHNRIGYMKKGSDKIAGTAADRGEVVVGKTNHTRNADIFEISPKIAYQFTKNFSVDFVISQILGDMQITRGVLTMLYNF